MGVRRGRSGGKGNRNKNGMGRGDGNRSKNKKGREEGIGVKEGTAGRRTRESE